MTSPALKAKEQKAAKQENKKAAIHRRKDTSASVNSGASRALGLPLYLARGQSGNASISLAAPSFSLQRQTDTETVQEEEEVLLQSKSAQAKLAIGNADDPMEKQADAVAEQAVMQKNTAPAVQKKNGASNGLIQKACAGCEAEMEEAQAGDLTTQAIQRKPSMQSKSKTDHAVATTVASPGNGEALHDTVKAPAERVLNSELSQVRVHNDERAQSAASAINARAFTHRNNIFLAKGESSSDLGLMAHEATHTVQQSGVLGRALIQREAEAGGVKQEKMKGEDPRIRAINHIVQQTLDSESPSYKVVLHAFFTAKKFGGLHQLVADLRARAHSGYSTYFNAALQTIRIHGNEKMFQLIVGFLKKEGVTLATWELAKEAADPTAVFKLENRIDQLKAAQKKLDPNSTEYKSIEDYISKTEDKLEKIRPPVPGLHKEGGAYPKDVAIFTSYMIRGGYIQQVAGLIPATWRTMSQDQLTKLLGEKFSEKELRTMFLDKYEARAAVKARFRKYNIVAALAIGLIWAKDNIAEGDWATAAAKVGGTGVAAYAFNKLLYSRDLPAKAIMQLKGKEFGRWFQGVGRTSKKFNFLIRRVGPALLIWDLKDILMSGGMGGPNIPFDLIVKIDIDDPSTWIEPNQTLLDFGFNIWYEQICTPIRKEACTATPLYLAKVEGSALGGLAKLLELAPRNIDELKNNLYRIEGELELIGRKTIVVSASSNALVIATGKVSPTQTSFSKGDYRDYEVVPANRSAENLLGGTEPRFIPQYVLSKFREGFD